MGQGPLVPEVTVRQVCPVRVCSGARRPGRRRAWALQSAPLGPRGQRHLRWGDRRDTAAGSPPTAWDSQGTGQGLRRRQRLTIFL